MPFPCNPLPGRPFAGRVHALFGFVALTCLRTACVSDQQAAEAEAQKSKTDCDSQAECIPFAEATNDEKVKIIDSIFTTIKALDEKFVGKKIIKRSDPVIDDEGGYYYEEQYALKASIELYADGTIKTATGTEITNAIRLFVPGRAPIRDFRRKLNQMELSLSVSRFANISDFSPFVYLKTLPVPVVSGSRGVSTDGAEFIPVRGMIGYDSIAFQYDDTSGCFLLPKINHKTKRIASYFLENRIDWEEHKGKSEELKNLILNLLDLINQREAKAASQSVENN